MERMTELEQAISRFISRDSHNPVYVKIIGTPTTEQAARVRRTIADNTHQEPVKVLQSESVTIPLASYAALVRAKAQLDMIERMHHTASYGMENMLIAIFGKKRRDEDSSSTGEENDTDA